VELVELFLVALVRVVHVTASAPDPPHKRESSTQAAVADAKTSASDQDGKSRTTAIKKRASASNVPRYHQAELLSALSKYGSVYHLHVIVASCTAAGNWEALAEAYRVCKRPADAIECLLLHFRQLVERSSGACERVQPAVREALLGVVAAESWEALPASEHTRLLEMLLGVWSAAKLSLDELEPALIDSHEHLSALVPLLFGTSEAKGDAKSATASVPEFSNLIYTHAALAMLVETNLHPSVETLAQMGDVGRGGFLGGGLVESSRDVGPLLSSILERLSAKMLARGGPVVFDSVMRNGVQSPVPLSPRHGQGVPLTSDEEVIVFSCGHVFSSKVFFHVLLQAHEEDNKAREQSDQAREVAGALLTRYRSPDNVGLPCPACALATIRGEKSR
jgi:hypothetical protein